MNSAVCFVFVIAIVLCGCRESKPAESASEEGHWSQFDDFHFLMAESFHPYADSGNLAPARLRAEAMADLAEAWSKADLPAKVDNEEVRALLIRLRAEASDFTAVVSTGDDARVGESLNALHDLFHEIQERWYAAEEEHPEH